MSVSVRLLGTPKVAAEGETLELPPGKTSAILYYLAYHQDWVSRDRLLYLFWPDADEATARKNLRQLLMTMRRLPFGATLEVEPARLRWPVESDVAGFVAAVAEKNWLAATERYHGDLLSSYVVRDLEDFAEWLEQEREKLQRYYREAIYALADELEATGRYPQAADLLAKLLVIDPGDEKALRRQLRALNEGGQREKALETYEAFRAYLQRELGGEVERETSVLAQSIRDDTDPRPPPERPKHNLPSDLTAFVGRAGPKRRLHELLATPAVRLVTLVGPGGIGKTRLATEVAREAVTLDTFPDGVWFVDLAPVTEPDPMISAIAGVLGFTFYGSAPPKEQLVGHLRDKALLLVLDNLEQLVQAAALVAGLLGACPKLKALATSREALQVRGEREFPVPPLTLPDLRHPNLLATVTQYEAVEMFIERAVAVKPTFGVDNDNAAAVAEICHRLDGLPLAIELAAARVKVFTPQVLLARLGNKLQLLAGGARDLPPRQRTLRGAIEWSFDLLTAEEKRLFARLSVFSGGRSFGAAEAVCNVSGDTDVLAGVSSLVNKSLLRQDERGGEPRFVMLETLHEFAREKLELGAETELLERRHAEYFLGLAQEAEPHLRGPEQAAYLQQLETELDNFRGALRWATRHDPDYGLRLSKSLRLFWYVRGYLTEGRAWAEEVLERAESHQTPTRAKVLHGAGILAWSQGDDRHAEGLFNESLELARTLELEEDTASALGSLGTIAEGRGEYAEAASLYEQAIALQRKTGNTTAMTHNLYNLGLLDLQQSNYASARARFEESLALYRGAGDQWSTADTLNNLGLIATNQGRYLQARALFDEAVTLLEAVGDKQGVGGSLSNLGRLEMLEGRYAEARSVFERCRAVFSDLGDRASTAVMLNNLGGAAKAQGDLDAARATFRESLALARELGHQRTVAAALLGAGDVALIEGESEAARSYLREGLDLEVRLGNKKNVAAALRLFAELVFPTDPGRAARLWGADEAIREGLGVPLTPGYQETYAQSVAAVQQTLGRTDFERAWADGRGLSWEEAAALAVAATAP